jgi:cold shock protein
VLALLIFFKGKWTMATATAAVLTGTVKWFNGDKGWGFIIPDGGGPDIFVHYSGIVGEGYRSVNEGDRVQFVLADGRRKGAVQAAQVTKI